MPWPETVICEPDRAAVQQPPIISAPKEKQLAPWPRGLAWPGAVGPADQALIRPHDGGPDLYAWPWHGLWQTTMFDLQDGVLS